MLMSRRHLENTCRECDLIRQRYLECLNEQIVARNWFDTEACMDIPDAEGSVPVLVRAPKTILRIPVTQYGYDMVYGVQAIPCPDYVDMQLRVWCPNIPEGICFVPSVRDSGETIYMHSDEVPPMVCKVVNPAETCGASVLLGKLPDISTTWHPDAAPIGPLWHVNEEWRLLHQTIKGRLLYSSINMSSIGFFPVPVGATAKRVPSCEDLLDWWQTCGLIKREDWEPGRLDSISCPNSWSFPTTSAWRRPVEPSPSIDLARVAEIIRGSERSDLRGLRSVFTTDGLSRSLNTPDVPECIGTNGQHGVAGIRGHSDPMGPPVSTHSDNPGHAGAMGPMGPAIGTLTERYNALVLEAQQRCAVPASALGSLSRETRERL